MSIRDRRTIVFVGIPSLEDLEHDVNTSGANSLFHFKDPRLSIDNIQDNSHTYMSKWRRLQADGVKGHSQDKVGGQKIDSYSTDYRVEELVYLEDLPNLDQFTILKQTLVSLLVVVTHISEPRYISNKIGQEGSEIVVLQVVDQTYHDTPLEITLWGMKNQIDALQIRALDVVFLAHVAIRSYKGTITGNMNGKVAHIQRLDKLSVTESSRQGIDQQALRLRDIYQWLQRFFDSQVQDSFKSTAEV